MSGYKPTYIKSYETGLVQERVEFILPADAFPVLENAFIWRERIKRRQGLELLGRLRRVLTAQALGNADGAGNFTGNIRAILTLEATSDIQPGSVVVTDGTHVFSDNSLGVLVGVPSGSGTINYSTTAITITGATPGAALTLAVNYYPSLPVMGIRSRELPSLSTQEMIVFDTKYAYRYSSTGFIELNSTTPTTWTGSDSDFFWSTNYWVDITSNQRLFWVTNFTDPIRYYNNVTWANFSPRISNGSAAMLLVNCLAMLPFRGRLVVFNTIETNSSSVAITYAQRIRWSAIGNPIPNGGYQPWYDDVRGQGGFLDIPISESITSVGFVRDNVIVYCERSTWQLRYTGRTIQPFQIERVNSELGAASTFSAVQFDTSLVGIGDKGIVQCDSYKSNRIDIKIPDLVFEFSNVNAGTQRVHGIRDFQQRLAYWIYPYFPNAETSGSVYPNRRLVYNYENDSWAIFTDSLTCLGNYQSPTSITWNDAKWPWTRANYPWIGRPSLFPDVMGGNQQGFVLFLGSNLTPLTSNEQTLRITAITGNGATNQPTVITSPNHNLTNFQVISISDIPTGTGYASLNDKIFGVILGDIPPNSSDRLNKFQLWIYDPDTGEFSTPQEDALQTYLGGGQISLRDNFSIVSKKFSFLEEGQNIQMGYLDVLLDSTDAGAISLNVFLNYNNNSPVNVLPQNSLQDEFFNTTVPTTQSEGIKGDKYWQRVYCPVRGAFMTLEWTLSNAQMVGVEQESDVEIDSQILWTRPAGRLQTI